MTHTSSPRRLDDLLGAADPTPVLDGAVQREAVALADSLARSAARRGRRWIPFVAIGVLALGGVSGAAVATDLFGTMNVHVEVDGEVIDGEIRSDVVIPIRYTTDGGDHIACTYAVAFVWGDTAPLKEFVATHDWSGLGQRAYEEHVRNPYYPSSGWTVDTDGVRRALTPEELRASGPVFSHAVDTVFTAEIPADIRALDYISQGSTDCAGETR